MSDPIQCFMMLTHEDHKSWVHAGYMHRDVEGAVCSLDGGSGLHKASVQITYGARPFDQLVVDADGHLSATRHDGQLHQMKCKCGLWLKRGPTVEEWGSSHSYQFENPQTGQIGDCHTVATPGAMWYCPWYVEGREVEDLKAGRNGILSRLYVEQWLGKRMPIMVMLPDKSHWCIDQKSSNGEGWTVTGDEPMVTASPSILVPRYHGFLQNGILTPDLEGRVYN